MLADWSGSSFAHTRFQVQASNLHSSTQLHVFPRPAARVAFFVGFFKKFRRPLARIGLPPSHGLFYFAFFDCPSSYRKRGRPRQGFQTRGTISHGDSTTFRVTFFVFCAKKGGSNMLPKGGAGLKRLLEGTLVQKHIPHGLVGINSPHNVPFFPPSL